MDIARGVLNFALVASCPFCAVNASFAAWAAVDRTGPLTSVGVVQLPQRVLVAGGVEVDVYIKPYPAYPVQLSVQVYVKSLADPAVPAVPVPAIV